jgi:hypothetical protein
MDRRNDVEGPSSQGASPTVDLPSEWLTTFWEEPMPDFVSIIRRHRDDAEPADQEAEDADGT